jgi:hypothetical protein
MRDHLSHAYLRRGEPHKTVALTARYPDDFCGPTLNRILALYMLEQHDAAVVELQLAARHHMTALKMLLAAKPTAPKAVSQFGITVGGKEEAWLYRRATHDLWEKAQALESAAKSPQMKRRAPV